VMEQPQGGPGFSGVLLAAMDGSQQFEQAAGDSRGGGQSPERKVAFGEPGKHSAARRERWFFSETVPGSRRRATAVPVWRRASVAVSGASSIRAMRPVRASLARVINAGESDPGIIYDLKG
jgi:hypothetical protein